MIINYLVSILFLFVSFLLFKKSDNKLNIIHSIIYTICLLFCYNTVIIFFFGFIRSLFWYSIINYIVGIILNIISYRRKKRQEYIFNKKELLLFLLVVLSLFLVVWVRFRGFSTIIYSSDDSSIHYRSALLFSNKLRILDNYDDVVYSFHKMMPANYINAGLFIKIFSNISSYYAYIIYDSICYILYAMLFLVIILDVFKGKNYLYYYIICMLYSLSFPLNNLVFGFGYLGIGVMVVELLYYIIFYITSFRNNYILNSIVLFILNFTLFFSYYLFMPFVYFSLFMYYIILYRKKKIKFRLMFLYIFIALVIPFMIGFCYFVLPTLFTSKSVIKAISNWGLIYENITPVYLFLIFIFYLVYFTKNKKYELDYYFIEFYTLTLYTLLFFILYVLGVAESYYFYKLFYIYIFFVILFCMRYLIKNKSMVYFLFGFVVISMIFVYFNSNNSISKVLDKISIYSYNTIRSVDDSIIMNDSDLDLAYRAHDVKGDCEYNHVFYMVGNNKRNLWFYSIVGSYPVDYYKDVDKRKINLNDNKFIDWVNDSNYRCLVYYYDGDNLSIDQSKFNILYKNNSGLILKRK